MANSQQRVAMGAIVGILGALSVMTVATDARADVGNPGYFEFTVPAGLDSAFWFASGKHMELSGGGLGYFSAEIASNGDASDIGSSFSLATFMDDATPKNEIKATLEFRSTSTGYVDPDAELLDFDIQARVRFSYNGSPVCTSSNFTIHFSTANWDVGHGVCSKPYDPSTGEFCMVGGGFTVPQLPAAACGGNGNAINSWLNLGSASGTYIQILAGEVAPEPIVRP